jgi:hypothetical protein
MPSGVCLALLDARVREVAILFERKHVLVQIVGGTNPATLYPIQCLCALANETR